jgi:hypothetical protein
MLSTLFLLGYWILRFNDNSSGEYIFSASEIPFPRLQAPVVDSTTQKKNSVQSVNIISISTPPELTVYDRQAATHIQDEFIVGFHFH